MLRAGNGARGIVYGARSDGTAHVWNAVVQNGKVNFPDFQSGRGANWDGYAWFAFVRTN
ncbi:toxin glutamine deamidase domain-containing protein [Pseudofrankia sp. BMG5.37]|uniref:toxin glutamine deamidase domain-containing protein n=1 Tax=Pseudofrankia sp. BMG5.37 TaxID=3050035 RepID=UPI0037C5E9A2